MTRIGNGLGALLAVVFIVAGVPWALVQYVGNPIPPEGLSLQGPLSDGAVVGLLAVVLWILWLQLLVTLAAEALTASRPRERRIEVPGVFEGQRQLSRTLVGAIVLGSVQLAALFGSTSTPVRAVEASLPTGVAEVPIAAQPIATEKVDVEVGARNVEVTVERGDSLWSIAERRLGDGQKWREIATLNEGRAMPGGDVFNSSSVIRPGWTLLLPGAAQDSDFYIVRPGDTLTEIADEALGDPSAYREIFERSKTLKQPTPLVDPDEIYPGQRLEISTAASGDEAQVPDPGVRAAPRQIDQHEQRAAPFEESTEEPSAAPVVDHRAPDEGDALPGWVLPGLASGGALLSGALLISLRRRRSERRRYRQPGLVVANPSAGLASAEKSIASARGRAELDVAVLDELMRRAAAASLATHGKVPSLQAVQVSPDVVTLHLQAPVPTPAGTEWVGSSNGLSWTAHRNLAPDSFGPLAADRPAAWPLLVAVGSDQADSWLFNLEGQSVAITGDHEASVNLARYIAAEVACNPWSREVEAMLVGVGEEAAALDPARLLVGDDVEQLVQEGAGSAHKTTSRLSACGVDVQTARAAGDDADPWLAMLVMAGAEEAEERILQPLRESIALSPNQSATALVVVGPESGESSATLTLDGCGGLVVSSMELNLKASSLSASEAKACADLLQQTDQAPDVPAGPLAGDADWQALATTVGSLREELVVPPGADSIEPTEALLDKSETAVRDSGGVTAADLDRLAPAVTRATSEKVLAADPTLDSDLEAWSAETSRPRLRLLGPVEARTSGEALERRKAYYTEVLAYLATRPHGATREQVAATFDISVDRASTVVGILRKWCGVDLTTGLPHLPEATKSRASSHRGVGVYELPSVIVDLDLVRRLRIRGEARGRHGIEDYWAALRLVVGRPFDQLRLGGWEWVFEETLESHASFMVEDISVVVVTHEIANGELSRARKAAEIALRAVPESESARLSMAAVLKAEGKQREMDALLDQEVFNRDDAKAGPADASARASVLGHHLKTG